jgi:hypothetical protein
MNEAGLVCKTKHKFKATTDSCHNKQVVPNLLDRKFKISAASCHWVGDITYVSTEEGWMYEEKRQQLTKKREDIVNEIASHDNADDKFSECLISLVELASGSLETFKGSNVEGKRKLLNFVFSNLELKGGKLDFKLRPPFDMFVKCTKI